MIKVLGLALYGPLAASTRYRLEQYAPGLAEHGIDLRIHHLLDDQYLRCRFSGRCPPATPLLKSGWERLSLLMNRQRFDAAMLYAELFPLLPSWLELRLLRQLPYVHDLDDAFHLKYRRSGWLSVMRPALGGKIDALMADAAAVTAGSGILAEYARQRNRNTFILPTVVDTERHRPLPRAEHAQFTVGWIGSPTTAPYLAQLVRPLARLGEEGPVRLLVVGGKAPRIPQVAVEEAEWSEATEISLINSFDVGVMPLPDDNWAKGKCAFKLIQCMACGVPVAASNVGANAEAVSADCGFLANCEEDWSAALRFFRDHPEARQRMGAAGRARAERLYSLRVALPVLADILHKTAASA
ncbi:glycosyltransferase [Candidatus Electronema sp. TJ]|uniref:glycosyltransferase n=1 Tax=Candidatus Electronema sp. TJ TaxID=3401573 RepID=UPI003AA849AD